MLARTGLHAKGALAPRAMTSPVVATQSRTFISVIEKYTRALREFGLRDTVWKLYMVGDVKFGTLVGEDRFGTKYYESANYPYGQHRWAEFKFTHDAYDPSKVPPEWHSWLHHMRDEAPNAQNPLNTHYTEINTGSDAPYNHNLGLIQEDFTEHLTTARARGYGVGSLLTKWGEPDRQYLQPNHPLRNRNRNHEKVDTADPFAQKGQQ